MSIQKVVKACASFGSTDGSHLLHICFENITEYYPDAVFDKKMKFSQLFAQDVAFLMKPAYIQVLIKTMPEAKIKLIFLLRVNKVEGLIFILKYCMFRYSHNETFWGPWNLNKNL